MQSSFFMAKWYLPLIVLVSSVVVSPAAEPLFDRDPNHPWNRLRQCLFVRTTDDGLTYTREELESPIQALSQHLLEGPSHEGAIALLDDFLKRRADKLIRSPIKRAVLQRDLWAVFGTTAGTGNLRWWEVDNQVVKAGIEDTGDEQFGRKRARRELQRRLVAVMRRIALSAEEIAALPNNLLQATKSGLFPCAYDPAHPQQAFLPTDLPHPDSSWLLVSNKERGDRLAAPAHVQFTNGRSLFLVYLHHPQGKEAGKAYLAGLGSGKFEQFPEGTQVALVRRMLLIDDHGDIRVSPVTEEVQFRVFQSLTTIQAHEFLLQRKELFAGRGGLRSIGADEASYYDISGFHGGSPAGTKDLLETKPRQRAPVVMDCCVTCHRVQVDGGIRSVASAFASDRRHLDLQPARHEEQVQSALNWVKKTYSWGLLQGLWESQP
jgi:hypothetical protein